MMPIARYQTQNVFKWISLRIHSFLYLFRISISFSDAFELSMKACSSEFGAVSNKQGNWFQTPHFKTSNLAKLIRDWCGRFVNDGRVMYEICCKEVWYLLLSVGVLILHRLYFYPSLKTLIHTDLRLDLIQIFKFFESILEISENGPSIKTCKIIAATIDVRKSFMKLYSWK